MIFFVDPNLMASVCHTQKIQKRRWEPSQRPWGWGRVQTNLFQHVVKVWFDDILAWKAVDLVRWEISKVNNNGPGKRARSRVQIKQNANEVVSNDRAEQSVSTREEKKKRTRKLTLSEELHLPPARLHQCLIPWWHATGIVEWHLQAQEGNGCSDGPSSLNPRNKGWREGIKKKRKKGEKKKKRKEERKRRNEEKKRKERRKEEEREERKKKEKKGRRKWSEGVVRPWKLNRGLCLT